MVIAASDRSEESARERVIVGDSDGLVRAFYTATGEILWSADLGGRVRSAPAYHEAWGIVVFALASGRVHALEVDSGGEAWKQELKEKILAPPTITIDGRVIVGTRAGGLYALDGKGGGILWEHRLPRPISHSAVATRDSTLIVAVQDIDKSLVFLDAATGNESSQPIRFGVLPSASPAVDDNGRIFFAHSDGQFVIVSPIDGPRPADIEGRPAGVSLSPDGNSAWVGSSLQTGGHKLWRFNVGSGTELDDPVSIEGAGAIDAAPIVGQSGTAYVASRVGEVSAIAPDGNARLLFRTSDARIVAQPVMSDGGTLFVGDSSGMFHAIQTDETGAWPTVNQNAQRTGQATGEYALPGEVLKEVTVHPKLEVRSLDQTPVGVAEAMKSEIGPRIVAAQAGWFEIETLDDKGEFVEREEVRVLSVPIQRFFVSEEVPIPEDANIGLMTLKGPSVYKLNADGSHEETEIAPLLWRTKVRTLHALVPGEWRIEWKSEYNTPFFVDIRIEWPNDPALVQPHIAGSLPVQVTDEAAGYTKAFLWWAESAEARKTLQQPLANGEFERNAAGLSVLVLGDSDEPKGSDKLAFLLVNSVIWDHPSVFRGERPATIGSAINYGEWHKEPNHAPLVLTERARVNEVADGGYYDRKLRRGPIIPVNEDNPSDPEDDLVLAFYQQGESLLRIDDSGETISAFPGWSDEKEFYGDHQRRKPTLSSSAVYWPVASARYHAAWPDVEENCDAALSPPVLPQCAERLVIAAQSADPFQLDDGIYGDDPVVYRQNDPDRPGYNPNEEHAFIEDGTLWAVRSDLNSAATSKPYVLVSYRTPGDGHPRMKVVQVVPETETQLFLYEAIAGKPIAPPSPLGLGHLEIKQIAPDDSLMKDRTGVLWAYRAGHTGDSLTVTTRYCYRPRGDFDVHDDVSTRAACQNSDYLPWLAVHAARKQYIELGAGEEDSEEAVINPVDVRYVVRWPTSPPVLKLGGMLTNARDKLPQVYGAKSVEVVYQQSKMLGQGPSVSLLDALKERTVELDTLPEDLRSPLRSEVLSGKRYFSELSPHLRHQFYYDENRKRLAFRGRFIAKDGKITGEPTDDTPSVLLNVLTERDAERIKTTLGDDPAFEQAVDKLKAEAGAPLILTSPDEPAEAYAIAAAQTDATGYVTIALNNAEIPEQEPGLVQVSVFRVEAPFEAGRVIAIEHSNAFAEEVYVRHSGTFGGYPEEYEFDWRIASVGTSGRLPLQPPEMWSQLYAGGADDPDHNARLIKGFSQLADNYVAVRFGRRPGNVEEVEWLSGFTEPQLVEGWLKRVADGIGPFDAKISHFRKSPPSTTVSMIEQAGRPYRGPVPLDQEQAEKHLGLIEIYETVFQRGKALSIDGAPARNVPSLNKQLQHFAGVLSDLYFLLGNEAQADAVDPTVVIPGTNTGAEAPDIGDAHTFKGQVPSLLEEELALLRGVSDSGVTDTREGPAYNRLRWNITSDNLYQPLYVLSYGISEDMAGTIAEESSETRAEQRDIADIAQKRFPQGHGDAYGQYLSALKVYYSLIRDDEFDWNVGSGSTLIGSEAVGVDYFDERRFAQAAVGRARTGLAAASLSHRRDFMHGTPNPFSRVERAGRHGGDSGIPLAWGMGDWASRSGQGAYFDWVVGNALLPEPSDARQEELFRNDRTTVPELGELADIGADIQRQLDQVSSGLNPLGVPPSVVPFDIDVNAQLTQQRTAFDIFYGRVLDSFKTARHTLLEAADHAQRIQNDRNNANRLRSDYEDREFALNARLIELFGTPFPSDMSAGKPYQTDYNGPDIYLFDKHRCGELFEQVRGPALQWSVSLPQISDKSLYGESGQVATFQLTNEHFECIERSSDERRSSPGAIQTRQRELVLAANALEQSIVEYENHIQSMRQEQELVQLSARAQRQIIDEKISTEMGVSELNALYFSASLASRSASRAANSARAAAAVAKEAIPHVVGVSSDVTSVARAVSLAVGEALAGPFDIAADFSSLAALGYQQSKEVLQIGAETNIVKIRGRVVALERLNRLRTLIRQEPQFRNALYTRYEAVRQAADNYRATLAEAQRVLVQRHRLRSLTAGEVRQLRYRDMTYRLLRSKASARYSAQFNRVMKEVFLLARVFDYSTNYAESDPDAPASGFYERLLRTRTLGVLRRDGGLQDQDNDSLASILAEMVMEYDNFRQFLGVPHRQLETMSLRTGLFRIPTGIQDDGEKYDLGIGEVWRRRLQSYLVPSLKDVPELRGCCRDMPQGSALVIPFATPLADHESVFNYFGFLIGGGDAGFNSSLIDSKLTTVRVVLDGYDKKKLTPKPRVYLVPAGEDIFRIPPSSDTDDLRLEIRSWSLGPQRLPDTTPGLSAFSDSADSRPAAVFRQRRFGPFDAMLGSEQSNDPKQSTRLTRQYYGRSIYNTRWLLVIPARVLNAEVSEERTWEYFLGRPGSSAGVKDIQIEFSFTAREGV